MTNACGVVKNIGVDSYDDSEKIAGNIRADLTLDEEQIVCSHDFDLPVPQILKDTVEADELASHERVHQHTRKDEIIDMTRCFAELQRQCFDIGRDDLRVTDLENRLAALSL